MKKFLKSNQIKQEEISVYNFNSLALEFSKYIECPFELSQFFHSTPDCRFQSYRRILPEARPIYVK